MNKKSGKKKTLVVEKRNPESYLLQTTGNVIAMTFPMSEIVTVCICEVCKKKFKAVIYDDTIDLTCNNCRDVATSIHALRKEFAWVE